MNQKMFSVNTELILKRMFELCIIIICCIDPCYTKQGLVYWRNLTSWYEVNYTTTSQARQMFFINILAHEVLPLVNTSSEK